MTVVNFWVAIAQAMGHYADGCDHYGVNKGEEEKKCSFTLEFNCVHDWNQTHDCKVKSI